MATDCAIFEAVCADRQPPTLRLYGWEPMCLSLGYGQRSHDVDTDRLRARGWQLVRRPTGGKAILHGDELTYSLCLPRVHPLAAGDVVESYRRIGAALAIGLEGLGVTIVSELKEPGVNAAAGPVCFEIASHYEITVGGRKLVGSAQMRRKGGLLQHGAIPICGDVGRICDVLSFEREEAREAQRRSVRERAATLASTLSYLPSWDDVADAILKGVERTFGVDILCKGLSTVELDRIETLMAERFANPDWTAKR